MLRRIAKVLLGLVTIASPVVIAACYGPPVDGPEGAVSGWVRDRRTGQGIAGIEVRCLRHADVADADHTDGSGAFALSCPLAEPGDSLVAVDVDGPANGSYRPASEPLVIGTSIVILLDSSS